MKSSTETIITALRVLARDIQTYDGVINACLSEAERLEELDYHLKDAHDKYQKAIADFRNEKS